MTRTAVAADDHNDNIRQGRLEWVAATLKLPQQMGWQAWDRARRITQRRNDEEDQR